jgi:ATP-dependent helicase/DNAse subunit B
MYLYLIKNTKNIKNPKLAGAYIEHILDELKNAEPGKTYSEIEKGNSRLEGLTTKAKDILEHIDNNYEMSSFIKGIKVKNDGEFYNYSKVYTEEEFDKLLSIIDDNINNVITAIENCDFKINPKRYITAKPNDIIGCEFCPFKEVCYVNAKNIVILNKTTMEEKELQGGCL